MKINNKFVIGLSSVILIVIVILVIVLLTSDKFENLESSVDGLSNYGLMGRCEAIEDTPSTNQIDNSLHKKDIVKLYNDLSFSRNGNDELPNGGLLVSMFDNNYACNGKQMEYKALIGNGNGNSCISVNDCEGFDFKDIQKIMNQNTTVNMTSCYALDTSYMRADFPSVLFGPLISDDIKQIQDMSIGLILDINLLKKYSACMALSDSGSVGRYNRKFENENGNGNKSNTYIPNINVGYIEPSNITDKEITSDYNNLLNSKKGRQLAQAGCGLQN